MPELSDGKIRLAMLVVLPVDGGAIDNIKLVSSLNEQT